MICLDEKATSNFIVFSCKHKVCKLCLPILLNYSNDCPMCQRPIHIYRPYNKCIICIILFGLCMIIIFYKIEI